MQNEELLKKAVQASKFAYIPYSKFSVGAAILMKDGVVIKGCNIENASFSLTNCAERTALFKAISIGYTKEKIEKIAVVADSEKAVAPCGACRQVLLELAGKNCPVILGNKDLTDIVSTNVEKLLPYAFENF